VERGDGGGAGRRVGIELGEPLEQRHGFRSIDRVLLRVPVLVAELFERVQEEVAGVGDDGGAARGDRILREEANEAAKDVVDGRGGAHILDGADELVKHVEFGAGAGGALAGFQEFALLGDGVPMAEVRMSRGTNHAATAAALVSVFAAVFWGGCGHGDLLRSKVRQMLSSTSHDSRGQTP